MAGLLLPEAVAYAGLAKLPVVHALSAMLVGLTLYALFGGSRYAIVSPTSSSATLAAAAAVSTSGAGALSNPDTYVQAMLAWQLDDLVAIDFTPDEGFDQTPGAHAGRPLEPGR